MVVLIQGKWCTTEYNAWVVQLVSFTCLLALGDLILTSLRVAFLSFFFCHACAGSSGWSNTWNAKNLPGSWLLPYIQGMSQCFRHWCLQRHGRKGMDTRLKHYQHFSSTSEATATDRISFEKGTSWKFCRQVTLNTLITSSIQCLRKELLGVESLFHLLSTFAASKITLPTINKRPKNGQLVDLAWILK